MKIQTQDVLIFFFINSTIVAWCVKSDEHSRQSIVILIVLNTKL